MKRKATAEDMVSFVLLICTLVIVLVGGIAWRSLASQNASEVMYHYTLAIKDKEVQLLKDGFEKSAAFFALMSTARELALHGGISADALSVGAQPYVAGVNPPLRFAETDDGRVPYWIVPSNDVCGQTEEQVPFFEMSSPKDFLSYIGSPYAPEGASAVNQFVLLGNSKHNMYIANINAGEYPLMVLFRIYFLKPGSVTVGCGKGCAAMEPAVGTPAKITTDGLYLYKITNVSGTFATMELNFTATGDDGDGRKVAKIEQVVVSIYDHDLTKTANNLFTKNLNLYNANMKTVLFDNGVGKSSQTTIDTLVGSIYRKNTYSFTGSVWPEAGIRSETEDYLGNDQLLTVQSSGMTEETTGIRYWLLHYYAEKYVRVADKQGPLEYYLFRGLDRLTDVYTPSKKKCVGGAGDLDCTMCPTDDTPTYTAEYITGEINKELQTLSGKYNLMGTPFKWNFQIVSFGGCKINEKKDACSKPEECQSNDFEHYEYKRGTIKYAHGCPACDGKYGDDYEENVYRCKMYYYHRYVLKNAKILVTITDDKYRIFDNGGWKPLEFQFITFVHFVDDNCCGSDKCDDGDTACTKPPYVEPTLD